MGSAGTGQSLGQYRLLGRSPDHLSAEIDGKLGEIPSGNVRRLLERRIFSHANVPYRIKAYSAILADCYDTIDFDEVLEREIVEGVEQIGTDGKLLLDRDGHIVHVNLTEKLLILLLAKLSNFVPEGGIWMNTQRPEWNDANNALVGKGLSMVTLCYLRRYLMFCQELFRHSEADKLHAHAKTCTICFRPFSSRSNVSGIC